MKNCSIYRETFASLALGQVPEGKAEPLRKHISNCPECSAYYNQLQTMLAMAKRTDTRPMEVPQRFARDLRMRLRADAEAKQNKFSIFTLWQDLPLLKLGAVAVVLLFLSTVLMVRHFSKHNTRVTASVAEQTLTTVQSPVKEPSLLNYRQAAFQSPETLEQLITRHGRASFSSESATDSTPVLSARDLLN